MINDSTNVTLHALTWSYRFSLAAMRSLLIAHRNDLQSLSFPEWTKGIIEALSHDMVKMTLAAGGEIPLWLPPHTSEKRHLSDSNAHHAALHTKYLVC